MQAEGELSYQVSKSVTATGALGFYDKYLDSQRHYILWNSDDQYFIRAGRFFPAYGIYTEDHSSLIRKGLEFNQGRESYNLELGMVSECGEIFIAAIQSSPADLSTEDKGISTRIAWYAGGRSQLGVSALTSTGTVWQRSLLGLFAIAGLTRDVYLLSEVDQETKSPQIKDDPSIPIGFQLTTLLPIRFRCSMTA